MMNEFDVEPDYFIDLPPYATFIPQPRGKDKTTMVQDRIDPDLYDYELEVEPILQVLVGKAIENARIEVIEEFEKEQMRQA